MRYEEVHHDMHVIAPAQGDAIGVVLHKRTPPAGEAPTAVYVYWWLDGREPSWIAAEELEWRGEMPSLPVEQRITDGTGHERVFWRHGREYRVHNMWSEDPAPGRWIVSHRDEDGTMTTVVDNQRDRDSAKHVATRAIDAFDRLLGAPPVGYVVVAADTNACGLRVDVPEADQHGHVHTATPAEGLEIFKGKKAGRFWDVARKKFVRHTIDHFRIYPVRADGSVGAPTLHSR